MQIESIITRKHVSQRDPLKRRLVEIRPPRGGVKFWLRDGDGIMIPATKRGLPKESNVSHK